MNLVKQKQAYKHREHTGGYQWVVRGRVPVGVLRSFPGCSE